MEQERFSYLFILCFEKYIINNFSKNLKLMVYLQIIWFVLLVCYLYKYEV